jgi:hypothetical protein
MGWGVGESPVGKKEREVGAMWEEESTQLTERKATGEGVL